MSARPRLSIRCGPLWRSCGHPCRLWLQCVLGGRLGHHQGCGSVVVPPRPGRGVAGGVRTPVRLPAACLWLVSCHRPRGKVATWSGGAVSCVIGRRSEQQAAPYPSRARQAPWGIALPGGCTRPGGATRPPPLYLAHLSRHGPRPTGCGGIRWPGWYPCGGAAVGHREPRAPASVSSHPTRACRRR